MMMMMIVPWGYKPGRNIEVDHLAVLLVIPEAS